MERSLESPGEMAKIIVKRIENLQRQVSSLDCCASQKKKKRENQSKSEGRQTPISVSDIDYLAWSPPTSIITSIPPREKNVAPRISCILIIVLMNASDPSLAAADDQEEKRRLPGS
jgi:hypothetical protein